MTFCQPVDSTIGTEHYVWASAPGTFLSARGKDKSAAIANLNEKIEAAGGKTYDFASRVESDGDANADAETESN